MNWFYFSVLGLYIVSNLILHHLCVKVSDHDSCINVHAYYYVAI
jgi:hypothetical protein